MKHKIGDIWTTKKGETLTKNEQGKTVTYYRYLVERYIGGPIPQDHTIHHIDFNHQNNDLKNLMIVPTKLHVWIHRCKGTQGVFCSNLDRFKKVS